MDKHLHIVTHDVPWPADYGGVIDIFYSIKALHQQGVQIHLHCFTKERQPQSALAEYCSSINYYDRKKSINSFSLQIPLIVKSRISEQLLANLQKDSYPILLQGIHCTYYLLKDKFKNRKIAIRLFNTEFEYYKQLANHETNFLKKLYYQHESRLLKKYEIRIAKKGTLLALSSQDVTKYQEDLKAVDVHFIPVFLPYTSAVGKEGKGNFCLYHGNLEISENEKAATWLIQEVFSKLNMPFVIAGKNPSAALQQLAKNSNDTCLIANPSEKEMQDMICKAHIHVLPSFNNTGVKLKLLNAIFNGRHCLVNNAGVSGSALETFCHIADNASSFQQQIQALYLQPFTQQEIDKRQGLLQTIYNNEKNARELMTFLW